MFGSAPTGRGKAPDSGQTALIVIGVIAAPQVAVAVIVALAIQ